MRFRGDEAKRVNRGIRRDFKMIFLSFFLYIEKYILIFLVMKFKFIWGYGDKD